VVSQDDVERLEGRQTGERTMAGVQADDEARLLLDFLRHFGGRGVSMEMELLKEQLVILTSAFA
jgi:hypothetical protein